MEAIDNELFGSGWKYDDGFCSEYGTSSSDGGDN